MGIMTDSEFDSGCSNNLGGIQSGDHACLLIPKPKLVFVNKKQNEDKTVTHTRNILKKHFRGASCYASSSSSS